MVSSRTISHPTSKHRIRGRLQFFRRSNRVIKRTGAKLQIICKELRAKYPIIRLCHLYGLLSYSPNVLDNLLRTILLLLEGLLEGPFKFL